MKSCDLTATVNDAVTHDCMDNGMDSLHLIIGLIMGQNGVSRNHLKKQSEST